MKKIPLLACMCVCFFAAFSQKVDLDKYPFSIEYRSLPSNPMGVKTYGVSVQAPNDLKALFGGAVLEDLVSIEGLKKVSYDEAQAHVDITMKNLQVNKWKVEERVQVLTDNTGKETGRKSFFRVDVNYTCPFTVVVRDYWDNVVSDSPVGAASYLWSSSEFGTSKEATDYYSANEGNIRKDLSATQNKANFQTLSSWLTSEHGYKVQKEWDLLWVLNSKKHPENQAQQDALAKFKAAITKITADQIPDDVKVSLREVIAYFDGVPGKFTTDEKNDKKMRYGAYFNKAKIYFYLDEPEAAMKEADALVNNGYDDADGKRIKKDAESLVELFKKNKKTSRHLTLENAAGSPPPAIVSWAEQPQKFRVKKITESRYDKAYGDKAFLVYDDEYVYTDDGAIFGINRTDNGKPAEGFRFGYLPNEVTIKRGKSREVVKTFSFENLGLKDYKSDRSNTFSFTRAGSRITGLVHDDRCNKILNNYQFEYDGTGKITRLNKSRKDVGAAGQEVYSVVYDAQGRIQTVNRGNSNGGVYSNQYNLERKGDRVSKVHFSVQGKPSQRIEFDYDENGNVREQRFYAINEKEERLHKVLTIAYEEAKGNDYILWNSNHWMFGAVMGLRSYADIETPCY